MLVFLELGPFLPLIGKATSDRQPFCLYVGHVTGPVPGWFQMWKWKLPLRSCDLSEGCASCWSLRTWEQVSVSVLVLCVPALTAADVQRSCCSFILPVGNRKYKMSYSLLCVCSRQCGVAIHICPGLSIIYLCFTSCWHNESRSEWRNINQQLVVSVTQL